ncbi:uncharacterized protein LOC128082905 isoform X3 [Tympanuchus pallidicinctus]|uniref:uncharacterized protein LOC128082905 isoform X3 n=1 Tax=Tympanuchus pallidicinctus TaxID=109042 RepID=UPI002286F2A3|nr:uncharacterized protein LOC128082905 isoform X3 [Tympanuchus pallidicinctus]
MKTSKSNTWKRASARCGETARSTGCRKGPRKAIGSSSRGGSSHGRGQRRGSTVHPGTAQHWVSACQQVLHAVFFFGRMNQRQIEPNEFLLSQPFQNLKENYPRSFQEYNTHLPTTSPYSILLQFGKEVAGCNTQEEMESFLHEFNSAVEIAIHLQAHRMSPSEFVFRAAVVAYSFYREPKEPENKASFPIFYGASVSCRGMMEKKIMISILCLRTWHKAVAFAVYHGQDNLVIVFPDEVQCRAFCYSNGVFIEKPPCVNCKMMYHVNFQPYEGDTRENVPWPHGNCAENESLSKLLQGTTGLQEKVVSKDTSVINNPPQNNYQAIEQEFENNIQQNLRNQLIRLLQNKNLPHRLQFFEP